MQTKQIDQTYIAGTYARFDVALVSGSGSLLYDENGKSYIDLGTGIAVNTFGASDEVWAQAVSEQAKKLAHTSNLYYTQPCALLAQQLCQRTGMKKVFFSNSGAEANECLIKAARKWAQDKFGPQRRNLVTLKNSFHGRTLATLAATGQDAFHQDFAPLPEGFLYAQAGDLAQVEQYLQTGTVCGVLVELVQGEGGVVALDKGFVQGVWALCQRYDAAFCIDEVQTGNGRTGTLYAFEQYGVVPDIVSTAKGLAGGLPLGATLLGERTQDVFTPGTHGSTFGGNPVCCAGALSVLSRIDETLLAQVRAKSAYIVEALSGAKGIKSVSGLGLMLGVETEAPAGEIVKGCMEKGVLVLTAKTKVRLLPALNIPMDQLETAIGVLKAVCAEKSGR